MTACYISKDTFNIGAEQGLRPSRMPSKSMRRTMPNPMTLDEAIKLLMHIMCLRNAEPIWGHEAGSLIVLNVNTTVHDSGLFDVDLVIEPAECWPWVDVADWSLIEESLLLC